MHTHTSMPKLFCIYNQKIQALQIVRQDSIKTWKKCRLFLRSIII